MACWRKNIGGEYAARAMPCEEKPAGLNNKRKHADTERNRGAETGASNSKRSCIPIATKQSKWRYFVGGVGGGWGKVAQGFLPPGIVAYVRYWGRPVFVVFSGGGCGDIKDRDSKLT